MATRERDYREISYFPVICFEKKKKASVKEKKLSHSRKKERNLTKNKTKSEEEKD